MFEQLEDLENCVTVLDGMLQLPAVQRRLAQMGRRMEVMLGYSDSSKDAGPVTATLALHSCLLYTSSLLRVRACAIAGRLSDWLRF